MHVPGIETSSFNRLRLLPIKEEHKYMVKVYGKCIEKI